MRLEFDLGNPSFTFLHRAGLAGLWMSLNQLTKEKVSPPEGLKWELDKRRVILEWEGSDRSALDWLLTESFQLKDGLIALRGIDAQSMKDDALAIVHQGILGTLLQHNQTHKSDGQKNRFFMLEEGQPEIEVAYKSLTSYAYQTFASNLCDNNEKFLTQPINIAGWLHPGAVVRHIAFSQETSFKETPENALILLFAPVACYYYILRSQLRDKRALYALVIPEIIDLQKFAKYKQDLHQRHATYKDFHACGLGDAGMRFLTYEQTAAIAEDFGLRSCQVITLGSVAWSSQQKTRTDLFVVEAKYEVCHNYKICRNELSDRVLSGKKGGWVASSFARELIAENLAKGQDWYVGFADKINSQELFNKLIYERGGLFQMVEKVEWDDEREKLFVIACHEALYYTYGQVGERAKKADKDPRFDLVNTRLRVKLSSCKSADKFREFIVDFWSRAGRTPTVKKHWQNLMFLVMDKRHWKKARDLTLLALASYSGKVKEEEEEEEIDLD